MVSHAHRNRRFIRAVIPMALAVAATHAAALNFTWTGTTNNNWDTNPADLNWTTAWSNAASRISPNSAVFNLATPATVSVTDNIDANVITFSNDGWTLSAGGGHLAFGGSGTLTLNTVAGTATVNAPIVDGLSFGTGGGITSLTKSGNGTLILGGNNTYTGGTTVSAGTLQLGSASALSVSSLTISGGAVSGATVDLNGFSPTVSSLSSSASTVPGVLTNSAAGTSTFTVNGTTNSTFAGSIRDGAGLVALTKSGTSTLTLSGQNSYSGNTTINAGALNVTGSILGTSITVNPTATLIASKAPGTVASTSSVSPNAVNLQGGSLSVTANLDFAPFLNASSTGGNLLIDTGASSFTAGGTNAINFSTLPGGASLRLGTNSTASTIASSVVLTPDTTTNTLRFGAGSGTSLTYSGIVADIGATPTNLDITGNNKTVLAGNNTYSGATTINGTLSIASTGSVLNSAITVNTGGTLIVAKTAGTVAATSSVAPNAVKLQGGSIDVTANLDFTPFLNASTTGGGLLIDTGATSYTAAGTNAINFNNLPAGSSLRLGSKSVASTIAPTVVLTPDTATNTLRFGAGLGFLVYNGVIGNVGATPTNIDITGFSTTTLGGVNTYSGTTNVSGPLQINNNSALGSGSGTDADATTVNPGGVLTTLTGVTLANEKIIMNGGTANISTNGPISLNAISGLAGTLNGVISGSAAVVFNSTTTLAGSNTYTGATTIASSVQVTNASGLGAGTGTDADGTTINAGGVLTTTAVTLSNEKLTLNGGTANVVTNGPVNVIAASTITGTYNGAISGSANLSIGASGATISASNPFTGQITLSSASLTIGATGSLVSVAQINLNSGGTLFVSRAAGTDPASNSVGPHSVVFSGGIFVFSADVDPSNFSNAASTSGTLAINIPNFTAGGTNTIDFSAMAGGNALRLGSTSNGTIAPAVTLIPDAATNTLRLGGGTGTLTYNGIINDVGATPTKVNIIGTGTTILGGASTYTGGTTLSSNAVVTIISANALGSAVSGTTVQNTATLNVNAASPENLTLTGGTVTINAAASGAVTVNSGTLNLNANSSQPITMNGGVVDINAQNSSTISESGGFLEMFAQNNCSIAMTAGTVQVSHSASAAITATGGKVILNYTDAPYTGAISLANTPLQINTTAGATVNTALTVAGTTNITNGTAGQSTLTLQTSGISGSGILTTANNVALTLAGPMNFSGLYTQGAAAQYTSVNNTGNMVINTATNSNAGTTVASSFQQNGVLYLYNGVLTLNGTGQVTTASINNRSSIVVNGNATFGHLSLNTDPTSSSSGLFGTGTLTISDQALNFAGGTFDFTGTMPGATQINKTTSSVAQLQGLPSGFGGAVNVQAGELQLIGTINPSTVPINLSPGVMLSIYAGSPTVSGISSTYSNPLNLNGATGPLGLSVNFKPTSFSANVTLAGPIDLGAGGATFGNTNANTIANLLISGNITGGQLTIDPMLKVTLTSASASFNGLDIFGGANFGGVYGSAVLLQTALSSTAPIQLDAGSNFTIDNSVGVNNNRIPDTAPISMQHAWLVMEGFSSSNVNATETVGAVTLSGGSDLLSVHSHGTGNLTQLTVSSIQRNPGAVLDFEPAPDLSGGPTLGLSSSSGAQFIVSGQAQTNFLGGAYTYGLYTNASLADTSFLKYTANGATPLVAGDYFTGSETLWNSTLIPVVANSATITLSGSRSVLALKIGSLSNPQGATVNLGSNTLNLVSGGLLVTSDSVISGTTGNHLTAGGATAAELFFHGKYNGIITISANITNNPGPDGLYDPTPGGPLDTDNGVVSPVFTGNGTTYTLSGSNSYSGTTYLDGNISPVILTVNSAGSIGSGPIVLSLGNVVLNGAFTAATGPITLHQGTISGPGTLNASSYALESGTISAPLAGDGTITKTTNQSVSLSNIQNYTGAITITGGTLTVTSANNQTVTNPVSVQNGTLAFTSGTSDKYSWHGPITLGNGGNLNILNGTIDFAPSSLSLPASQSTFIITSGVITASGSGDNFTDSSDPTRHMSVQIAASGSVTNTLNLGPGTKTLAGLSGNGVVTTSTINTTTTLVVTATSQYNGLLQDGNGKLALNIAGGTFNISNANTYTGGTTVSAGTLLVTNTTGSATGTGTLTLNGGTLSGSGKISGTVVGGSGSHTIAPSPLFAGTSGGTLTLGGLTTDANTTLSFDFANLAPSSTVPILNITSTNALTMSGGTIQIADTASGPSSLGYYKIIQYAGTIQGSGIASLTLPATSNNIAYFLDTTHDPGFIDLHRGFLGDTNDDGVVDLTDLTTLAANWQHSGSWQQGDFNGDGFVDLTDLTILAENWQGSMPLTPALLESAFVGTSFDATSVPEPSSLALLLLPTALFLRRRRTSSIR